MKRFWKDVSVEAADGGWRVTLDGRPIKTQAGGVPQVVPTRALAEALAAEWAAQGEEVDPKAFFLRDLADYAIDQVAPAKDAAVARLLPFAETDTLCYRADPDEPLFRRQQEAWEPLVAACEARHGVRLERVSGIVARPQPPETLERLREVLAENDPFTLAARCGWRRSRGRRSSRGWRRKSNRALQAMSAFGWKADVVRARAIACARLRTSPEGS